MIGFCDRVGSFCGRCLRCVSRRRFGIHVGGFSNDVDLFCCISLVKALGGRAELCFGKTRVISAQNALDMGDDTFIFGGDAPYHTSPYKIASYTPQFAISRRKPRSAKAGQLTKVRFLYVWEL